MANINVVIWSEYDMACQVEKKYWYWMNTRDLGSAVFNRSNAEYRLIYRIKTEVENFRSLIYHKHIVSRESIRV